MQQSKKVSRKSTLHSDWDIAQHLAGESLCKLCEICVKGREDNTEKGNEETSLALTQQSDVSR